MAAMHWWGSEQGVSGQQRQVQQDLLSQDATRWKRQVRYIFDRGYGTGP